MDKAKLKRLAEETFETASLALNTIKSRLCEAEMKDLNVTFNNTVKAHKDLLAQLALLEQLEAKNDDVKNSNQNTSFDEDKLKELESLL